MGLSNPFKKAFKVLASPITEPIKLANKVGKKSIKLVTDLAKPSRKTTPTVPDTSSSDLAMQKAQQEAMRQQMELALAQFKLQEEANRNQQAYLANLRESQAPTEQEKQALDAGRRSRSATEAEKMRRRGLMSLFTRYMSKPESSGAAGGKATILGV